MSGALNGIRVIEFGGIGPGPFCGMMLADHGADVIRIDRIGAQGLLQPPERDCLNRSRTMIGVDLKSEQGVALARKLCRSAEVVFEGYRPGIMEKLGLGPEILLGDNPGLVYGRMTGFGQTGPYANMAGHDINYIALSGVLHGCGREGQPPTPPLNLVGDFGGGGMMLGFGLLAAIIHARATGFGQVVDCAMTEGSAVLMSMIYSLRSDDLWIDRRGANLLDGAAPFYDSYETADGKFIALGSIEPQFHREMLRLVGLGEDPDMAAQDDRTAWPRQKAKIAATVRQRTRGEWVATLEGSDACFAPVLTLDEAPQHPHNISREAFVDVAGAIQPAPAPRLSQSAPRRPTPPVSGVDTVTSVLRDLGIAGPEIRRLLEQNIIA